MKNGSRVHPNMREQVLQSEVVRMPDPSPELKTKEGYEPRIR